MPRILLCFAFLAAKALALTPSQLQAAISAAVLAGAPSYSIPPGVYNFSDTGIGGLNVTKASNLIIEGGGAVLVFYPGFGVTVLSSVNVTVQNLTVDYYPPCFTQGVITAVNVSASTLDVAVE